MYQREMFSDGSFKGAKFINSGCFGAVYTHPEHDDWVIKYGMADGTLNYLEWCKAMQDAGKGMRGMPEIDILTHMGDSSYMVTMRRYEDARSKVDDLCSQYSEVRWLFSEHGHDYLGDLVGAFDEYCSNVLVSMTGWSMVNDLHRGNIMWNPRKSEFVITDPSCSDYCKNNTTEFNLH